MTTPAQRRDERVKHATQSITRTVFAFVVVSIVALSIVGCEEQRNRQLARENRAQLRVITADQHAFDRFRAERAKLTTRTDELICNAVNALKASERARDTRDFRNLDRNLRLLNIAKTPAIVRAATRDYRENLRRTKPLKCSSLPTATNGANPKPKSKGSKR